MTRKVLIFLSCSAFNISLMRGYMIGSPTRERAQCFTLKASARRSGWTPSCKGRGEERSEAHDRYTVVR